MASKYYGYFNPAAAAKVFKTADRYFCQITEDGSIYAGSGYVLFKLTPADYAAIVQPVACCDAGNWTIDKTGRHDGSMNAAEIFTKSVKAAEHKTALQPCPLQVNDGKKGAPLQAGFYNAEDDFSAFYNAAYIAAVGTGATIKAPNAMSAAIVYHNDEASALVMPIRPEPKASRAVKAYFTDNNAQPAGDNAAEIATLRAELEAARRQIVEANKRAEEWMNARDAAELEAATLRNNNSAEADELRGQLITRNAELLEARDEIAAQRDEINDLQAELAELAADNAEAARLVKNAIADTKAQAAEYREQIAALQAVQQQPDNKPEPKTAAELIAARFADMAGVTTTIKGAQTAAPVVWLAGDTTAHAKAIEAAGGKWSNKKSAYYVRVA